MQLADASDAWSMSLGGMVKDLIVGDDGAVYILMPTSMVVLDA